MDHIIGKELHTFVNDAKRAIKKMIDDNPDYFGTDEIVKKRLNDLLFSKPVVGKSENPLKVSTSAEIMRCVDLTILDKQATDDDVIKVAERAAKEHCATVCVYPEHIPLVSRVMSQKGVEDVPPIAVVGFPFVNDFSEETTQNTIKETKDAIAIGAKEIDMVLPITFKDGHGDYDGHFKYIKAVVDAAHELGVPVKVILETAYLTDDQIALASMISKIAGADWVKTSTGFAEIEKFAPDRTIEEKGATPKAVAIMRQSVGYTSIDDKGNVKPMGVKASGGVRNRHQALDVIAAGADRIGASGGINVELEVDAKSPVATSTLKY